MLLLSCLLAGCTWPAPRASTNNADAAFTRLADEYIAGYLAWRPQTGTSLGLHEYDGKVTDYSQASLGAELARLKSFDQQLGQLNTSQLRAQGALAVIGHLAIVFMQAERSAGLRAPRQIAGKVFIGQPGERGVGLVRGRPGRRRGPGAAREQAAQ